ncbi:MAG: N-acetyl-alpha-D-glucosaminyl L-malate synthase BshA [Bacteroidetes bacterium]|nr:N-acetyl-alpha-D-glucosaminyl L-malate synthase BshA [Bacteroidota bacterium]
MNIGIVCYPTFGGSGVVATELAKGLAKKGHTVHIISYARPARLEAFETHIVYHEVTVQSYPLFEYPPYGLALANMLSHIIENESLDVLHVHYALPHTTSAYLACQILGDRGAEVPIVTTLHGTDITLVGRDPSYKRIVDFSLNQSDGITAVSEYLKAETIRQFDIHQDVVVIPNFIDLERFSRVPNPVLRYELAPEGEPLLMHVSNFRKVKRVVVLVEMMAKLLEKGGTAKLIMVGDGPERLKAESLAKELGVLRHIRFLGKQEQVEQLLSMSDVFLLPSGSETFGLAALEAMACGVPVVSTNIGGLPEVNIHGETGYLVELDDAEAMADYTLKILRDDALKQRLSTNARARAEVFEQSKVVQVYEEFYQKCLANMSKKKA